MTIETTTLETTTNNLRAAALQLSLRAQFEQVRRRLKKKRGVLLTLTNLRLSTSLMPHLALPQKPDNVSGQKVSAPSKISLYFPRRLSYNNKEDRDSPRPFNLLGVLMSKIRKARRVSFSPNAQTPEWATRDAWSRNNYEARTLALRLWRKNMDKGSPITNEDANEEDAYSV